ncbi:MAG: response regulator transcription factor [Chloroflexi bacterium]|nr:response regulator transcription factor [Chloroflexota bacterium]
MVTLMQDTSLRDRTEQFSKVLIVEDAVDLCAAVDATLYDAGYDTRIANSGDQALREFYAYQPDLVLLDLGLPGMAGIDVCEAIRRMSNIPVIIFSALGETADKLEAFDRGADDYIVKGAEMQEVVARVGVALRRAHTAASEGGVSDYSDPQVHIDFGRRTAVIRGKQAELTRTEYELLVSLISAGQPMSASQLLRKVWGPEYNSDELVKWHIGRLRKKIEVDPDNPSLVVTRRGFGYMYVSPQA